jgi:hypothetical protein
MSRPLLDLVLLHLVDASDDQRRALAHEMQILAGLS